MYTNHIHLRFLLCLFPTLNDLMTDDASLIIPTQISLASSSGERGLLSFSSVLNLSYLRFFLLHVLCTMVFSLYPLQRNGHVYTYTHSFISYSALVLCYFYTCAMFLASGWHLFSDYTKSCFYLDTDIEIYWMAGPLFIELKFSLQPAPTIF